MHCCPKWNASMAKREAGCLELVDWLRHGALAIDDTQQIAYER
jgi:hypothetical protein